MIWFLYILMALGVIVFLAPVLIGDDESAEGSAEVETYFAAIDALNENPDMDEEARAAASLALKRQLLERPESAGSSPQKPWVMGAVMLAIVGAGAGVYALEGTPDTAKFSAQNPAVLQADQALAQAEPPEHESGASLAQLIQQLEARLQGERADDPNGWLLYARSLMNLNRFEEAIIAYDRVVLLTDNNPEAIDERARARAFIAQRQGGDRSGAQAIPPPLPESQIAPPRGPSADDVDAAMQMSADDRQAMIEGMVESLAGRLQEQPNDPAGWARLLRARAVLGQTEARSADIETIRELFKDQPELRDQILQSN